MDDEQIKSFKPNPWHPITNSIDLKYLGKLSEEAGELVSAATRCIIQGINEAEPITGKINKTWLEDECADVLANIELVAQRFNLDRKRILDRLAKKQKFLKEWYDLA